ncbi:MAG: hypothetical protein JW863_01570, partial [Chitinispirillaceae bacterium]|nr:hypothetical protein [Chitinispirillaceae bacterium]
MLLRWDPLCRKPMIPSIGCKGHLSDQFRLQQLCPATGLVVAPYSGNQPYPAEITVKTARGRKCQQVDRNGIVFDPFSTPLRKNIFKISELRTWFGCSGHNF